ncbi:MAG: patatin-like phospholipase family protein [Fusobacterium sp.]|nr:patatin-like phospholipase family protein [Fusobacterium sp.]
MKRVTNILILILMLYIPIKSFSEMSRKNNSPVLEEDIEIKKLKEQISILNNKIKFLEKSKALKLKKDRKNMKIALALSGGGAKGLAHVGVLRVLEENNIKIDCITGTSMGAVVGALYSIGYTPDEIEKLLLNTDWNSYINGELENKKVPLEQKVNNKKYAATVRYDKEFNLSLPKGIGNTEIIYLRLKKIFAGAEDISDFDKLPIPLRVVATDLNSGKAVALGKGDLARAVTASIAIPTILEPVEIDGNLYVDGLVSRNLPVEDALKMGADIVIASDVGNEVKDNKDYNILSVLNQLVTIQSASSTQEQRNMATILISPDIQNYSATDIKKGKELIELGKKATLDQLYSIEKLPKREKKYQERMLEGRIYVENIKYSEKIPENKKEIFENILGKYKDRYLTYDELEEIMLKIYNIDFVNKVYYDVQGNDLVLDAEINPANLFGIGASYSTGYGTTFNIGTEFTNINKLGNTSSINAQFGDYLGVTMDNFFYYGLSNKIGVFANAGYYEAPLYLYDKTKKIADYTSENLRFETGILTQYNNEILAAYGIAFNYVELKQDTGFNWTEQFEYSKKYNEAFLKLSLDKTNKLINPTSGIKGEFNYVWEGSYGNSNSNLYGPLYVVDGYIPLNKKLTLSYGVYGGVISGDNISIDKYIKLGGNLMHRQLIMRK